LTTIPHRRHPFASTRSRLDRGFDLGAAELNALRSFGLAAVFLAAFPTGGQAAKPAPVVEPIPRAATLGVPPAMVEACSPGVAGPPAFTVNYIVPPHDVYYTLLRRASCTTCASKAGYFIDRAFVTLNFPVPCTQSVTVAIFGALGDSCPTPDPANPIAFATPFELTGAGGVQTFTLALPAPTYVIGDAFLALDFVESEAACGTTGTRPRLVVGGGCTPCVSYNAYPGGGGDLCSVSFPGNPLMSVGVDSCGAGSTTDAPGDAAPAATMLSLSPNPLHGRALEIRYTNPTRAPSHIEVLDVLGRRMVDRAVGTTGAATGTLVLEEAARWSPGVYLVRFAGERASRRFVIVR